MRAKCRGYEGELIILDAAEKVLCNDKGEQIIEIAWYGITIRANDGAKIELSRVREEEIEVVNERKHGK